MNYDERRLNRQSFLEKRAFLGALRLLGLVIQVGMFAGMWHISGGLMTPHRFWGLTAAYCVLFVLMARIYDGMEVSSRESGEIICSMGMAQLFALLFQYFLACLVVGRLLSPLPFLLLLLCGVGVSAAITCAGAGLYRRLFPPRTTYVVYDYLEPDMLLEELQSLSWKFQIDRVLDLRDGMERTLSRLEEAEAVILCGVHASDRNTILKACVRRGTQLYIQPKIGDLLLSGADRLRLCNVPVLRCGRSGTSLTYVLCKRLMDLVLSGIALVVLSPLMGVVALVIRHADGGPALYRQVRLTQDGRTFEILKFRSMRVDAEKDGVARLAEEGDSRITPVGRFIRSCRIDELPQLLNILRGDMSIVGPRPERPEIAAQYEEEMPEFGLRLQAKAGLTGYAQVYGRYNTGPYDKLQMDLLYIANQSLWQDIKLIFLTVKVLFVRESTEGVAKGQVTASDMAERSSRMQRRAG